MKLRTLMIGAGAILLSGCAHDRAPWEVEGPGSEDAAVQVRNHYVPVYYTPHQEWGVQRFVPGYARQGVIVTPSRVWTYGQGQGFRTRRSLDMEQMTGRKGDPCSSIKPLSRRERIRIGMQFINLSQGEVMNEPFSASEQNKLVEYQQNGCNLNAAAEEIRRKRWQGVLLARQVEQMRTEPVVPMKSGQPGRTTVGLSTTQTNATRQSHSKTVAQSKADVRRGSNAKAKAPVEPAETAQRRNTSTPPASQPHSSVEVKASDTGGSESDPNKDLSSQTVALKPEPKVEVVREHVEPAAKSSATKSTNAKADQSASSARDMKSDEKHIAPAQSESKSETQATQTGDDGIVRIRGNDTVPTWDYRGTYPPVNKYGIPTPAKTQTQ